MFGKTPVATLHEYCAKKRVESPKYTFAPYWGNMFSSEVEALNLTSTGYGRSKKEAKHDSATNLIRKAQPNHPDLILISPDPSANVSPSDLMAAFSIFGFQDEPDVPTSNIGQCVDSAEASPSTSRRSVLLRQYEASRQKPASNVSTTDSSSCGDNSVRSEPSTLNTESGSQGNWWSFPPQRGFFKTFHPDFQSTARRVLSLRGNYANDEACVKDLFKQLNIVSSMRPMATVPGKEQLYSVDLQLPYDIVFITTLSQIYSDILSYFQDVM